MSHRSHVHPCELVLCVDQGEYDNRKEAFVIVIKTSRLWWLAKAGVFSIQCTYSMRDVPCAFKRISNGSPFLRSGGTCYNFILVFIHNSLADLWDELGNGVTWNSEATWEARIAVIRGQVSEGYSNPEAWFSGFLQFVSYKVILGDNLSTNSSNIWGCRMMLYLPSLTLASDDGSVHTWVSLGQTAMVSPEMLGFCVFFASTVLLPGQAGENASYFAVSTAIRGAHLRALPLWHIASNWTHAAYACLFYNPL